MSLDSTITFGACDNRKCVNISIIDDREVEFPEYFNVILQETPGLSKAVSLNQTEGKIWIHSANGKDFYSN